MTARFGILGRSLAVTITAGVALGLAGCGDQESAGAGGSSKDSSSQVDSGSSTLTRDELIPAAYQASLDAGSAHMSMSSTGPASLKAEGDVAYDGDNPAIQMTIAMAQMGQGEMEMRYVDKMLYLQIPGMTPKGKFVAVDPADKNSPLGKSFAGLSDQMDPLSSMKAMRTAVKSVDHVGEEKIDGTSVDHYKVVVDTAKVLKAQGQAVPQGMPTTLPYDMWLDEKDLVRKMTFEVAGSSFTMEMTKWGDPVDVQAPAAADLVKGPGA